MEGGGCSGCRSLESTYQPVNSGVVGQPHEFLGQRYNGTRRSSNHPLTLATILGQIDLQRTVLLCLQSPFHLVKNCPSVLVLSVKALAGESLLGRQGYIHVATASCSIRPFKSLGGAITEPFLPSVPQRALQPPAQSAQLCSSSNLPPNLVKDKEIY